MPVMIAAKVTWKTAGIIGAQAADVPSRVDRAAGIAERRAQQGDLAGDRRAGSGQPAARDDDDADEADDEPDDAVDAHRFVGQEDRRQDDREERDGRGQDRGERRFDRLLGPGDEQERDRDVDDRHDQQVAVDPAIARQRLVGDADDGPQQEGADEQPEGDERERPEVVDGELDEQVARAPHEAKGQEDAPSRSGSRARSSRHHTDDWPTEIGQ